MGSASVLSSTDCNGIPVIIESGWLALVVVDSRDAASVPGVLVSFHQQSFFLWPPVVVVAFAILVFALLLVSAVLDFARTPFAFALLVSFALLALFKHQQVHWDGFRVSKVQVAMLNSRRGQCQDDSDLDFFVNGFPNL